MTDGTESPAFEPPTTAPATDGTQPTPWLKRPVQAPRWVAVAAAVVVLALIGAAAQQGPTQDDLDAATDSRDQALADLAKANGTIDDLETANEATATDLAAELAEAEEGKSAAETERDEAIEARDAAIDERDLALEEAEQAAADRDEVLARFDPQIQASIAQLVATADSTVCAAGDSAGFNGQQIPTLDAALDPVVSAIPEVALPGGPSDYLSMPALEERLASCYAAGKQRGTLMGPHGDGFFTIGVEMAAGRWRSDGQASNCYWQISPDGNPDDIIDNHFGNAGGTVTLREGQEFESDGCGTWTLVG